MKFTYDPRYSIAYIRFAEKSAEVEAIRISDELIVDLAPNGTVYGIEFLNANEQLARGTGGACSWSTRLRARVRNCRWHFLRLNGGDGDREIDISGQMDGSAIQHRGCSPLLGFMALWIGGLATFYRESGAPTDRPSLFRSVLSSHSCKGVIQDGRRISEERPRLHAGGHPALGRHAQPRLPAGADHVPGDRARRHPHEVRCRRHAAGERPGHHHRPARLQAAHPALLRLQLQLHQRHHHRDVALRARLLQGPQEILLRGRRAARPGRHHRHGCLRNPHRPADPARGQGGAGQGVAAHHHRQHRDRHRHRAGRRGAEYGRGRLGSSLSSRSSSRSPSRSTCKAGGCWGCCRSCWARSPATSSRSRSAC